MEIPPIYKQIGERIKSARRSTFRTIKFMIEKDVGKKFVTQQELAKILNVSFQAVGRYEKGLMCISIDKLMTISNYLNKPLDYFLNQDVEEHNVYPN